MRRTCHAAATVRGEQIRRGLGWVGLVVGPLPSTTGCSRSAGGGLWREKIAGENDQVLRTNGGLKASFSYACLFPKGKSDWPKFPKLTNRLDRVDGTFLDQNMHLQRPELFDHITGLPMFLG
jgi:hypothetical protein